MSIANDIRRAAIDGRKLSGVEMHILYTALLIPGDWGELDRTPETSDHFRTYALFVAEALDGGQHESR